MGFIKYSIGIGGKNDVWDVKIIQWMLNRAQMFYTANIFSRNYLLEETGIMDLETSGAIRDYITFRVRNTLNYKFQKLREQNLKAITPLPVSTPEIPENQFIILPDDRNYEYLLKCLLNPICAADGQPKADFSTDPLAVQVFRGTIGFYNFRTLAEAMDNKPCPEQRYGINIVTNTPYVALGFNSAELQRIKKGYNDVINPACSNVFIRNNLPTPAQVFQQRGVVFIHDDILDSPIPNELKKLGFTEDNWVGIRQERNSKARRMDAFTLGINRKGGWEYMPVITVFKNKAFNEGNYSFEETFAHETIHRSGLDYTSSAKFVIHLELVTI